MNQFLLNFKVTFLFLLFLTPLVFADTDRKTWKLKNGDSISAILVDYNKETEMIRLQDQNGDFFELQKHELNILDQEWVESYLDMIKETNELVKKLGGKVISSETIGVFPTTYHLYKPSKFDELERKPLMILFHPGGKGLRYLSRHIEAAEKVNLQILALDVFRNTGDDQDLEDELKERFQDVLLFIRDEIHDVNFNLYMGGSSGGAWRAYHYSAWHEGPWSGIYANGGWLGGEKYSDLNYPASMRVAIVNGHQDKSANRWVEHDSEIIEKKGSTVKAFVFEGAHQVPPKRTQEKAFKWLLGLDE